ncbi:MAG TPA: DUF5808 domain-containing protein [Terriglobales bacterium]|nr:DUF5808 domain-containing protein [Terriglobales bacterium]
MPPAPDCVTNDMPAHLPHFRLAALGPFVILAAAAWRLHADWNRIPLSFAMPSPWDNQVGWGTRRALDVYALPLAAAVFCAVVVCAAFATLHWAQSPHGVSSPAQRRGAAWGMLVVAYSIALALGLTSQGLLLRSTAGPSVCAFLLMMVGFSAASLVWRVQEAADLRPGTPARSDEHHWVGDNFYYNPSDKAMLVPRRYSFGYTLNCANRRVWKLAEAISALSVALMLLILIRG